MKRFLLLVWLLVSWPGPAARAAALDLPLWRPSTAATQVPAYRADRFTIQLTPDAARAAGAGGIRGSARALGVSAIDRTLGALGATIEPEFRGETPPPPGSSATDFTAFYLVDLPEGADLSSALDRFEELGEVAKASPIGISVVTAAPNDSLWSGAWHLFQTSRVDVHALEAWEVTQGDTSVVVAIIDTGVIPYHPDIGGVTPGSGQIWTNPIEARGIDGVDDDGNGYVDDLHGWDFVAPGGDPAPGEDWRDEDNDPNDFVGHGTTVAGIVGALSDNQIGITGVARNVRIMPLRVGWSTNEFPGGLVDMVFIARAIRYATLNGARVINISLSTTPHAELDFAVSGALAAGVSVVLAAGNNGSPNGIPDFPAMIQVTATDRNDVIPPWANVGAYVDFTAPGVLIPATNLRRIGTDSLGMRQPGYVADANGTSFAAPIASGAVALLQSARLQSGQALLDPEMVRLLLMSTCDDISAANPGAPSVYWGAGRLNIAKALAAGNGIRHGKLGRKVRGSAVEFTRSNGARALAVTTDTQRLMFLDAVTLAPFVNINLGGETTHDLAAADLGGGRGLGFFATLLERRVVGIGGAGVPLPGWPFTFPIGVLSATGPVLGDLDGDGLLDVVVVTNDFNGFQAVWAWSQEGKVRQGFPVQLGRAIGQRAALADLDGQPGLEIVIQDGDQYTHALRHDGRPARGWPAWTPGFFEAAPVVTRRDGEPLVVVINRRNWYAFGADGRMVAQRDLGNDLAVLDPALADLDQDGTDDALIPATLGLHAWYLGSSPTPSPSWPRAADPTTFTEAPVVGHVTSDAGPEILQVAAGAAVALKLDGTSSSGFQLRLPLTGVSLLSPVNDGRAALSTGYATSLLSLDLEDGSAGVDPAPWPTARGNFARTGCRWGAPVMSPADDTPPEGVVDLKSENLSSTRLRLTWHAPSDPGGGRVVLYDLRLAPTPISPGQFDYLAQYPTLPARAAGEAETLVVTVPADHDTYLRIRAVDGSGNKGPLSNQVSAGTPSAVPDPVIGLAVTGVSTTEIDLRWIATGDDGWVGRPARYEIAASPLILTEAEWARTPFVTTKNATVDAGLEETARLAGLPHDTHFWIAVRAVDDEGNRSPLSDLADASTAPITSHVEDLLPPMAVTDLRGGSVSLNSARLVWTAPADDAPIGRVVRYELRYASVPLTPQIFQAGVQVPMPQWPRLAGSAETLWVQPPSSETRYYSLRSFDAAGHASPLSNPLAMGAPSTPPARVADLNVAAASESLVMLRWTGTGEDGAVGRATSYEFYADTKPLTASNVAGAAYRFTVAASANAGAAESTKVRLPRWLHLWVGLRARDQFGVWSALSNLVEVETVSSSALTGFALELASNPCRAPVRFRWSTRGAGGQARLALHDVTGRRVRDLELDAAASGFVAWDGADGEGNRLPAGLYFAVLSTPSRRAVTRVVLLP